MWPKCCIPPPWANMLPGLPTTHSVPPSLPQHPEVVLHQLVTLGWASGWCWPQVQFGLSPKTGVLPQIYRLEYPQMLVPAGILQK